jgi:hypothetical protein
LTKLKEKLVVLIKVALVLDRVDVGEISLETIDVVIRLINPSSLVPPSLRLRMIVLTNQGSKSSSLHDQPD